MSAGVKLVSLSLQNVSGLDARVELGPFGGGVNLLGGRSHVAKTALVAALRAVLFERHDERCEGISALRARGTREGPEIQIDLTLDGEAVSVRKRFLEEPLAEVRLLREGSVFTGARAEEVLLARVTGGPPGAPRPGRSDAAEWGLLRATRGEGLAESLRAAAGARVAPAVDPVVAALDLPAQLADLTAQLGELERARPALEAAWKVAVDAERRARDLDRVARESEIHLANAEALLDAVHGDLAVRASLASEIAALGEEIARVEAALLSATAARREAALETLAALRAIAPDARLRDRRASALAALGPAHRSARSAAAALDEATPELLRGDTLQAQGAITASTRRAGEIRDKLRALQAWTDQPTTERWRTSPGEPRLVDDAGGLDGGTRARLAAVAHLSAARMIARGNRPFPLVLDDTMGWGDDGRLASMVQFLREASSDLQIIVLTVQPSRFNRLQVEYAADLDQLLDARLGAPGAGRMSG
jgi:hypothetical protein